MDVSLILSTKGRVAELEAFLDSLCFAFRQLPPGPQVELIISDQNDDNRLDACLTAFEHQIQALPGLHLVRLKSSGGLSRGRNVGLAVAKGLLIGFPDDDCLYQPEVLFEVISFFEENPRIGFLGVGSRDAERDESTIPLPTRPCGINERLMPLFSPTLFVRRGWLFQTGGFNEALGVGAPFYGAGEETDLVLRLLEEGAVGAYQPTPVVLHPAKQLNPLSWNQLKRQFSYGRGLSAVLMRHKPLYGYFFWVQCIINVAVRPLTAVRSFNRFAQALAYSAGVLSGFACYRRQPLGAPPPLLKK